jgi:hypothetical protein
LISARNLRQISAVAIGSAGFVYRRFRSETLPETLMRRIDKCGRYSDAISGMD